MRIDTDGKFSWREDEMDAAAERFGEETKVGGVMAACEWSGQMMERLRRAADHPDMTPELAELLSTGRVEVVHQVETGLQVRDRED